MAGWMDKLMRKKPQAEQHAAEPKLTAKTAHVDLHGTAVIPEVTVEIAYGAFQNKSDLKRVVLPPSVRKINSRAFALCENLSSVQLNEGLEVIEGNVFNGCKALAKLVFPDSLKEVHAYAFYCTSLQEPVYNRSGDILHHYPSAKSELIFTLPRQVKRLYEGAFFRSTALEEPILPEGLESIDSRAFLESDIKRLTIPSTVKSISKGAFWNCPELTLVDLACDESALEQGAFHACPNLQIRIKGKEPSFEQELAIKGISLLAVPNRLALPEGDFTKEDRFILLASRCARGDAAAMMELGEYFEGLGAEEFYACAANFWKYRAYQYGHLRARVWKDDMLKQHPRRRIPAAIGDNLNSTGMGGKFRALGFLFFEEDREYSLMGRDAKGIVEVRSWCGEEGPDEDGYGREELYDWWYLDEHLNPIPGVEMLHSYSIHEREYLSERFDEQYEIAVKAMQK